MPPPDDFDPDVHAPIKAGRCLAPKWFDDDPAPARCTRDMGHVGGHVAAGQIGFVGPAWDDEADEMGEVA